jgi:ribosomal protein L37E
VKSNKHTEAAPRFLEVILGVIFASMSIIFAVVSAASLINVAEWSDDDQVATMLVLTTLCVALTFFFASVAWRSLSGNPRRHGGGLLPPSFILTFGLFFMAMGVWMGFDDLINAWEVGVFEAVEELMDDWEIIVLSAAMVAWGYYRIRNRAQVCRKCGHPYEHQTRKCDECGYEVTPKEEFYPALWRYGCPRYDDCREELTFADDELRCPVHGGIYQIGEKGRAIPSIKIFNVGTHCLDHISGDVDEEIASYSIMACPKCDAGGNPAFSLYMRDDKEGATLSASCRACGLDYDEYLKSLVVEVEDSDQSTTGDRIET